MFFKKYGDLVVGIFFLALSFFLYIMADALPPSILGGIGSDFFPKIMAIATCILSFFQIRSGFKTMRSRKPEEKEAAEEEEYKPEYLRVLATIALFTIYVFTLGPVGFLISSTLYLFLQIIVLSPKDKRSLRDIIIYAIISIVSCVVIYFVFRRGLNLMLPTGILG